MTKNMYNRAFAWILLGCLLSQPLPVLAIDWTKEVRKNREKISKKAVEKVDEQLSKALNSPLSKDFAAFTALTVNPPKVSQHFLKLLQNGTVFTPENQNTLFAASDLKQKRTWVKLFDNLQFTNVPGKKSVFSNIGKTITQAGHLMFLNLLAQENQSLECVKNRQSFIAHLVKHPAFLRTIQDNLQIIRQNEDGFAKELFRKKADEEMSSLKIALLAGTYVLVNAAAFYGERFVCWAMFRQDNFAGYRAALGVNVFAGLLFLCNKLINDNEFLNGNKESIQNVLLASSMLGLFASGAGIAFKPAESLNLCFNGARKVFRTNLLQNRVKPKLRQWELANSDATIIGQLAANYTPQMQAQDGASANDRFMSHLYMRKGTKKLSGFGANTIHRALNNGYSALPTLQARFNRNGYKKASRGIGTGLLLAAGGLLANLKNKFEVNKKLFAQAKGVAQVLRSVDAIRQNLANEGSLNLDYEKTFGAFSADYKGFFDKANTSMFAAESTYELASLFSTNQARINNVLELASRTIDESSRLVQFYGEIDAYASMAQLILDHQETVSDQGEDIRCCFVEFLESPDSIVVAKEMWHPLISAVQVRTNSISLGDCPANPRNGIITGPNAAGKSASMKALLVNLILGQTFGVACAKTFSFTMFKKIIAQLGSVDDTANDQSKFMMEATSVVELLKMLQELGADEKAFVCTDELFSGTEITPAILLSLELCSRISLLNRVCYILATHYKDLTQLKEMTGNKFENYKVSAFIDANDKIVYPFKLTHGVGDTNVAFDIFLDQMHKQGIRDPELESIVQNARARQHMVAA